jgi:hypothetical protein
MSRRIFLLSPASTGGRRAAILLNPHAEFDLAVRLRRSGVSLGEVFSFLSGLYFRGKLAYALAFAREDNDVRVLSAGRGLLSPHTIITLADLRAFARRSIDLADRSYVKALRSDAERLAESAPRAQVVLLGSIASNKYVDVLLPIFGERLVFPPEFVGRGDMSRGGLMLRCAAAGVELPYVSFAGAVRHGKRPPKLEPVRWADVGVTDQPRKQSNGRPYPG